MPRNPSNPCPQRGNRGRNKSDCDPTPDEIEAWKAAQPIRAYSVLTATPEASSVKFHAWLFNPNDTRPLCVAVEEVE